MADTYTLIGANCDSLLADAHLVAAAPDLLAACEEMAAQLGGGDDYTKWEDAKAKLLAAITKAKGN